MREELVEAVKQQTSKCLAEMAQKALSEAVVDISRFGGIPHDGPNLLTDSPEICQQFIQNLNFNFDKLIKPTPDQRPLISGDALGIANADYYECVNAMEGMVAYARNSFTYEYTLFTTRFASLFFHNAIDETNNPLDPELICDAFASALRPLGLGARQTLIVYRKFNHVVLRNLGVVLDLANDLLSSQNVMPDLTVSARDSDKVKGVRTTDRAVVEPEAKAFQDTAEPRVNASASTPQLFDTILKLLHGMKLGTEDADQHSFGSGNRDAREVAVSTLGLKQSGVSSGLVNEDGLMLLELGSSRTLGETPVEVVPTAQVVSILHRILARLLVDSKQAPFVDIKGASLIASIGKALHSKSEPGRLFAIDRHCYDVITTLTGIFDVFDQDVSLVRPIKDLVAAMEITFIKIALSDQDFLSQDQHPARTFLNEIASASLGWCDLDKLQDEPLYVKVRHLVNRMVSEYSGDADLIERLVIELQDFKSLTEFQDQDEPSPQMEENEKQRRLDETNTYVSTKLNERVREEVHPVVDEILNTHFHKFLVNLVLKDGRGGSSWKHVMRTVDMMLWTVRSKKDPGDRELFNKLNERLLESLNKALRVSGLSQEDSDLLLGKLRDIQDRSFEVAESVAAPQPRLMKSNVQLKKDIPIFSGTDTDNDGGADLDESDEHYLQVLKLPAGIWLEFDCGEGRKQHCTMAARLDGLDRLIFVNRQGVKVVEKTRKGLARELKAGTVKIVSDWPLFERAMETVIARLRDGSFH